MKREANFWGRIVAALWSPRRILQRIENGVLDGMPDTYIVIDGRMVWIELKCPIAPVHAKTRLFGNGNHELSVAQRNWLLTHRQAGGWAFVGIETECHVFLIGARHADAINGWTVAETILHAECALNRPVTPAGWQMFIETLTEARREAP